VSNRELVELASTVVIGVLDSVDVCGWLTCGEDRNPVTHSA
jgi:hypothetical protein